MTFGHIRQAPRNQDEREWYEPSMKAFEVHESYLLIDYDGDGIAELRKVLTSNNTLLSNEVVPWVPFATGVPFIQSHRWIGLSVPDKMKDIQDLKTIFLRQYADNMVHHNNRRLAVVQNLVVDPQQAVESRPGGIILTQGPGAIQEIGV